MTAPQSSHLLTLLSCHSLEDFPLHLSGDQAQSLLTAWTAPWHPFLLAQAGQLPTWHRHDALPEISAGTLVFVPLSVTSSLTLSPEEISQSPARWILSPLNRTEVWRNLQLTDHPASQPPCPASAFPLDAHDFAALGFAYLQLQLMTRRLRYSHTLDEKLFADHVLAAAQAHTAGNRQLAREQLQAAFDLLLAERNRYYPVDAQLLELLLLDTEHRPTETELASRKANLLLPLETAAKWTQTHPELIRQIAEKAQAGHLQVLGTTASILPELLLPTAPLLSEYLQGVDAFQTRFGLAPTVFGRRLGGLHPAQPQILSSLGFRGALHLPLDPACRLPPAAAATLGWRGLGDQTLDAIVADPIQAAAPDSFPGLSLQIGEQIDSAHQATLVFAHWPNQESEPFRDLLRISRFSSLLGRFVTCDELFDTLYHPSYGERYDYDDYRVNLLTQWTAARRLNPISSVAEYHRRQNEWLGLRHLNTFSALFNREAPEIHAELESLLPQLSQLAVPPTAETAPVRQTELDQISARLVNLRSRLTAAAGRGLAPRKATPSIPALVLVNPLFAAARCRVTFPTPSPDSFPTVRPPVTLADRSPTESAAIVDLPASGFGIAVESGGRPAGRQPEMVVENTLRNEYFELQLDPQTGGIRRLRAHGSRNNLLSQQLAVLVAHQLQSPDEPLDGYTRMRAETLEFDVSHPLQAGCRSTGQLWFEQTPWARFEQELRITRGLRTIEFTVRIELLEELTGEPWQQYACSRLAFPEEPLARYRGLHDTQQPIRLEKFLAPTYVHIDNGHLPVTLFPEGLAFHRQSQLRVLDTLLITRTETAREFRFALGVGVDSPQLASAQRESSPLTISIQASGPTQQRFFHLSAKNLLVVDSWPTFDPQGVCTGAVLRFREGQGLRGKATLFAPKTLKGARLLDLAGKSLEALPVQDDQVTLEYHEHKLFTLQLYW